MTTTTTAVNKSPKNKPLKNKAVLAVSAAAATFVCAGGGATWLVVQHNRTASSQLAGRYTANGYGGYGGYTAGKAEGKSGVDKTAPAQPGSKPVSPSAKTTAAPASASDLIVPVRLAYAKGDYKQAETAAGQVVTDAHALPATDPKRPAALKVAARARYLQAFASARRHDMSLARDRFAQLTIEANQLPDKGKVTPARAQMGAAPEPTLLESAAYQHAVCTSALGDKAGAEREYMAFMKAYPDSPLVQASIKRIARFHGGDIPKEAEAVWQSAMKTAQERDREKQKQASLCAPQCLAELLKRQGKAASVANLTREMKTNERGTSLADLCESAKRHGFSKAQGVALTDAGLKKQKLPVVALVSPGHFVLVEQVDKDGFVRVWNPTGTVDGADGMAEAQAQAAATRTYSAAQWKQVWQGIALVTQ